VAIAAAHGRVPDQGVLALDEWYVRLLLVQRRPLDVLVRQEARLVRRAQHPRPHPVRDHHLVLLLGDPLQEEIVQVSDHQNNQPGVQEAGLNRTTQGPGLT